MKRKMAFLSVLLAGTLVFAACKQEEDDKKVVVAGPKEQEITYSTAVAEYDDITVTDSMDCTYAQTRQYDLSFGIGEHQIRSLNVKQGEMVQQGQLLASLDVEDMEDKIPGLAHEYDVNVLKLQQQRELKEFDKASANTLFANGGMGTKDPNILNQKLSDIDKQYRDVIQDLEDAVSLSSARLREAKEQVQQGMIYAPVTGEVTFLSNVTEGSYSTVGETVVTVSDLSACYFLIEKLEYLDSIKEGETYEVQTGLGDNIETYEVTPAGMESWEEEGCMRFGVVDDNALVELGTQGKLIVNLGEKTQVLCIPSEAIHTTEDGYYVYLLKDGIRQMQTVEIGLSGEEKTEITAGLKENDIVILKQEVRESDESE